MRTRVEFVQPKNIEKNHVISSPATSRQKTPLPDWLPHAVFLPCVLSTLSHAVLLLVIAATLRSCHQAPVGFTSEETREIGIFIKDVGNNPDAVVSGVPDDGDSGPTTDNHFTNDLLAPLQATPDQPP